MTMCPCGSGNAYADCCEPVVKNSRPAATAAELMRARYSAYTTAEIDFIYETTHPNHRKGYDHAGTRKWAEESEWLGLDIIDTSDGGPGDMAGDVEFIARFREKGVLQQHHERGHFQKKDGRWYFTDGSTVRPRPAVSEKIGRNDPCPCGTGKKYKKCCGK